MTSEHGTVGLWIDPRQREPLPPLSGDLEVDVAVVGGGLVGLTAAHLLASEGRSVAVLEAGRTGTRATGLSTAKVTSQHGLMYARLKDAHGRRTAQRYADANEYGRHELERIVQSLDIPCDLERQDAYVYTIRPERIPDLHAETTVARSLGLPAAFTSSTPLPFPVAGAVVFDGQSQVDPYAYLEALTRHLSASGQVYEHTRVRAVHRGSPCVVETEGGSVRAAHVIVASQLPILDRGLYFARAFPFGHAVIAARLGRAGPAGMFISVDEPSRSIRGASREGVLWLLVSGPRVPVEEAPDPKEHDSLERFARAHFPVEAIEHRWTNIDYESPDGLPYVGPILPRSEEILVATAFAGWGFSNGTAAARILADRILGRPNQWASIFDPMRVPPTGEAWARVATKNLEAGKTLVTGRLSRPAKRDPESLQPLEGDVFKIAGEQVAVSRGADRTLRAVSAICPHRGCVVGWNQVMQTWDCPCHGSVFDAGGEVVRGPSTKPLKPARLREREDADR